MSKFLYLLLIASLAVAHASPTAGSPTSCDLTAKPCGIYRVSAAATPATPVLGVYAKDVNFGTSPFRLSLPKISDETTIELVNKLSEPEESAAAAASASSVTQKPKNAMAIVFFTVWRTELPDGSSNFSCRKNPVRNDDDEIMIWSRSIPEDREVPDGYKVVIPEKGVHTEDTALEYLQDKDTQDNLWGAIVSDFGDGGIPVDYKLEMLGISIYSRLDACDSCLMKLSDFNGKGFEHLPPSGITCVTSPVSCVVAFDALERYRPGFTSYDSLSNGECSATLCVVPKHPFLKIGRESDDISYTHQLLTAFEVFEHMNEITLTSGMNPSFIIFCVNNGEPITVKVPT